MLDYFLTYRMGLSLGVNNFLIYIGFLCMLAFLLNDLPKGWKAWLRKVGELILFWCVMQLLSAAYYTLLRDSYLNEAQQAMAVIVYAAVCSRYSVGRRIVIACAGWACDMLVISIHGSTGLPFVTWYSLVMILLGLMICTLFLRRFAVEEFSLAPKHYFAAVVMLAMSGIIASGNWGQGGGFRDLYTLMVDVAHLASLFVVYALLHYLNQTYQRNMELSVLELQYKADEEVLLLTQKNNEEMHILRHELKNHDAYIRTLLEQGNYDELKKYVSQDLSGIVHVIPQTDSGNTLVNAVLNQKLAVAEAAGIRMDCQASVPEKLPYAEMEFCGMLANLLDNAIEACEDVEGERLIRLRIYRDREYLFIHMENPCSSDVTEERRLMLKTTKGDAVSHGYGTKVIYRVAKRYNGHVQYRMEDGRFISDVMLAMTGV